PVQVVVLAQALQRLRVGEARQLTRGAPDLLAELVRPADALALPERDGARHARGGRDEHPVARDLLDPPGRRAEQERLALPRLVDHLLVALAYPPRPGGGAARSIPDDPGFELGEFVRRVAAGEHVEHVLQLLATEV